MHVLDYAVQFARCCQELEIEPWQLRTIVKANRKAHSANLRHTNDVLESSWKKFETACEQLTKAIADSGLTEITIYWPGLYPSFKHKGRSLVIPVPRS